jgi:hypothetical protein
MPQLPLTTGAYEARGFIASAQRCENLFFEPNPKDAPFPGTHYPASGLRMFADYTGVLDGVVRGVYWASNGAFYAAIGSKLIQQNGPGQDYTLIGTLDANTAFPVSMVDNGTDMVLVDGQPGGGWTVNLATNAFAQITDPVFEGSYRVDYIDTYFTFVKPVSRTFYWSNSNSPTFDPIALDRADKIGWNDILMAAVSVHDNIWLLGAATTEVWFNAGDALSAFQRMPNSIIQAGLISVWGAVVADNAVYWISQDQHGRATAMRGEGYEAKRISTFAIENEWAKYPNLSDTYVMCYQQAGHEIVLFYFLGGLATWAYDTATGQWHRRTYGPNADPWLPSCVAYWGSLYDQGPAVKNLVIAGDRTGPRLLEISREVTTDLGVPIKRVRSWPHVINAQKRVSHQQFVAALQPGQLDPDQVTLRWSDDGGQTWGQPLTQTVNGATNGQYSWRRLGMARDRVYELSWTAQGETALNGAWIEATGAAT